MDKFIRFLWKYFLISSIAALLLQFTWVSLHRETLSLRGLLAYLAIFVLLACPTTLLYLKSRVQELLWMRIAAEYSLVRRLRWFCLAVLSISLLLSCVYSTSVVWRAGGHSAAHLLDRFGCSEAAERVISITADEPTWSYADLCGGERRPKINQSESDFEHENVELDNLIERVYGAHSQVMARRYLQHAFACDGAFGNYSLALVYYARAQKLYEEHGDWTKSVSIMHFIANTQREFKDSEGLIQSIKASRVSLVKAQFGAHASWSFSCVLLNASSLGIDVSADQQWLSSHRVGKLKDTSVPWDGWAVLAFPFTAPYALLLLVNAAVVPCAKHKWLSASRKSNSVPDYLEQVEKLMLLELAKGNLATADEYSRKSLELATAWKV